MKVIINYLEKCKECGELFSKTEMTTYNNERMCEGCAEGHDEAEQDQRGM